MSSDTTASRFHPTLFGHMGFVSRVRSYHLVLHGLESVETNVNLSSLIDLHHELYEQR